METKELQEAFLAAGWTEGNLKSDQVELFDGLFFGTYAICAVALAPSVEQILGCWSSLQGRLAELKVQNEQFRHKDIYLLLVVETVNDELIGELQRILDDTRVCRKICLEKRQRSITETLQDVPFFPTPGTLRASEVPQDEMLENEIALRDDIRTDLEKRGAERILDKLLNGQYEN